MQEEAAQKISKTLKKMYSSTRFMASSDENTPEDLRSTLTRTLTSSARLRSPREASKERPDSPSSTPSQPDSPAAALPLDSLRAFDPAVDES